MLGKPVKPMAGNCEAAARVLKLLAHPRRLQILCRLAAGEQRVRELEQSCGASQSQVSQFLGRMKSEGLLASRRDGNFVAYRIEDPQVLRLIRALHGIFGPR